LLRLFLLHKFHSVNRVNV